jgi:thioredoxin 1
MTPAPAPVNPAPAPCRLSRRTFLGGGLTLGLLAVVASAARRGIPAVPAALSRAEAEMTQSLNQQIYDEAIAASDGLVMVDFWAAWCGPCRIVAPILEQLADETGVPLMKVNIDENGALASRYGIRSIPTILFVKDGEVVDRVIGAMPKAAFQKVIDTHAE